MHEGDIYRLADDYCSAVEQIGEEIALGGEAPAVVRLGGRYWMLFSGKTSWDCNDNYCLSAPSMRGPWTYQGLFAPEGSMTCNSQTLFVLPVRTARGVIPMFMGDRWSFPHQAPAATYVWQPLSVRHGRLRLEQYWPSWDPISGQERLLDGRRVDIGFHSDVSGESISIPFHGSRVALVGRADQWGSYARIGIKRASGEVVAEPIFVSFYAKSPDEGYRYVSPELPEDDYAVTVTVTGEVPQWSNKSGQRFGSVGSVVDVRSAIVA